MDPLLDVGQLVCMLAVLSQIHVGDTAAPLGLDNRMKREYRGGIYSLKRNKR